MENSLAEQEVKSCLLFVWSMRPGDYTLYLFEFLKHVTFNCYEVLPRKDLFSLITVHYKLSGLISCKIHLLLYFTSGLFIFQFPYSVLLPESTAELLIVLLWEITK